MKVVSFELFPVAPRWLFLKLTTDDGLVGWGEPVVEGRAATVAAAVTELSHYVVGRDPRNVEDVWQTLYRGGFYRGGPILMSAIAGIDQALWDLKGKALGVPVYELLGGAVRQRMKTYCWIGGDDPAATAAAAVLRRDAGYKAIKMNGCGRMEWIDTAAKVAQAVANIAEIRAAVGNDLEIGIDFHGRVHKGMVKRMLQALESYDPYFVEEAVLPEHNDLLQTIYPTTSIPLATGERMYSRWDFKRILADGVIDVIQPDVSHAGGISETRRIAAMAEAYDVALAPHCPLGPIALAACLQVDFASVNALIQENSIGIHYNETGGVLDYLVDPSVLAVNDGYFELLTGPGLGIEIDEAKVRAAAAVGHSWKNPVWRHEDGAIAEW